MINKLLLFDKIINQHGKSTGTDIRRQEKRATEIEKEGREQRRERKRGRDESWDFGYHGL